MLAIVPQIEDIQGQADDAKSQAAATLKRATEAKNLINNTVAELRRFIKAVKDFLN
ncbi:hypothetical protein scyTo_0025412, partial [Scyliorhinus torazame]|nr:hypothetical protein [Scyliorhinus torazame]